MSDIVFTFASGALQYDCVACGAQCCRGHGFLVDRGPTLVGLLRRSPALHPFLMHPGRGNTEQLRVNNGPPGCFFLADDGRCSVQLEDGYAAKPETCRLFPFNHFGRIGRFLLVRPHPGLCPLTVNPSASESAGSAHQFLLQELAVAGVTVPIPEYATSEPDIERLVALERAITTASARRDTVPTYRAFVLKQIALARAHDLVTDDRSAHDTALHDFATRSQRWFGLPETAADHADPELTQILVGLTPYLRSTLLFRRASGSTGSAVVQLPLALVPYALLVLALVVAAAKEVGVRHITFQSVTRLLDDFGPVIWLLSQQDQQLCWRRDERIPLSPLQSGHLRTAFVEVARALLPASQARTPRSLSEILSAYAPASPADRALFIRELAPALFNAVVPVSEEHLSRRSKGVRAIRRAAQSRVERWMLASFEPDALLALHARRGGLG